MLLPLWDLYHPSPAPKGSQMRYLMTMHSSNVPAHPDLSLSPPSERPLRHPLPPLLLQNFASAKLREDVVSAFS